MSKDELNRKMEFIVEQQAIFSSDMIELKLRMDQTTENLDKLAAIVQQQGEADEINRREMREAIENLMIGNEATRELANRAAQLAINVS